MKVESFIEETQCMLNENGETVLVVNDEKPFGDKPVDHAIAVMAGLVRATLIHTPDLHIFGAGKKDEPFVDNKGNTLVASTGENRVHYLDADGMPHSAANFPYEELVSHGVVLHPTAQEVEED